ncbi:MAG: YHYH protein [Actinobacteria bacterium]|uniref:YHYH protein n=1 Tax=Candidatus Fonsibacter lacus TaxID=2576439 RepID=A0A965GDD8_9PROT|nr:YHYH protein [Candidatus Fonsibacter lacus]
MGRSHGHEIRHLAEIDRRKFLQVAGLGTGLAFFSDLISVENALGASATLPGFSKFADTVKITKGNTYYLVESSGLPAHSMMTGIKSWQQQVPTPQPYSGTNAWSIPIKPVISQSPMSAKNHFLRGAIAIAVNGVPIFNALNNRGDDAYLVGELDDWGGHCGRADDYHYHIAPLHLKSIVGRKVPIAYALDGFPIYGETEVAGAPLRGASITGFERTGGNSYELIYSLNGADYRVKYTATLSDVQLEFIDSSGASRIETYRR